MAKRLLVGKPNNEDYGLYVSKSGTDIVDGSNNLTSRDNLQFDSEVGISNTRLEPNFFSKFKVVPNTPLGSVTPRP